MTKPNYQLKAQVIEQGLTRLQKDISVSLYLNDGEGIYTHRQAFDIDNIMHDTQPIEWHEAEKVNNASRSRTKRLRSKISKMIENGDCVFVTMTINDEHKNSISEDTFKTYVKRYLKSQSDTYIANIDYGKENDRIHYHAIIQATKIDMSEYKLGYIFCEKVYHGSNPIKLAKYINKLTNHAIKSTNKRCAIIYSR